MIDDATRYLHAAGGYDMFGVDPEDFNTKEFFNRTIEDLGNLS
jgi:hypothetical protein